MLTIGQCRERVKPNHGDAVCTRGLRRSPLGKEAGIRFEPLSERNAAIHWLTARQPSRTAQPGGVKLMFWNAQAFDEPVLKAVGKFEAAQVRYADLCEFDQAKLGRWLETASSVVWDRVGLRMKTLAQKRSA